MSQALHPMLNVAIKAARTAGTLISRASMDIDLVKVSSKGANDFVTEVDQAAEAAIIDTLLAAYPGHGILAEETGRTRGAKDSEYLWIIDPLDGTTNFIHGFPHYNVSIGLAVRGKLEQAVVYDPNRNDLYYASKGRGAFLNDKRLRVSKRTRLADSLIGTGFPFRKGDNFKRYLRMFEDVSQACAGIRRPGAAALDLCYVAAGYLDGFFETGLSPWDAAAGALMITEAGGLVGNFTGESDFLYQRELVAGNPRVYAQLVTMLAPYTKMIDGSDASGDAAEAGGSSGRAGSPAAEQRATIGTSVGGTRAGSSSGSGSIASPIRGDGDDHAPAPDATSIFARSTVGLNDAATQAPVEPVAEPAAPRKPPARIKKADFVASEPEPKPQNRR